MRSSGANEKPAPSFIEKSGRPNFISRGRYDDWSTADILKHLKKVARQENRKPTKAILWRRINEESRDEPSPRFISSRIKFRKALELIGYPDIHSWEPEDYINWGVQFVEANDGNLPTARAIDFLSIEKRGPSAAQVTNVFSSQNTYKKLVWRDHLIREVEFRNHREGVLSKIENGLESGLLPREVFDNTDSEEELITQMAKYEVARDFFPDAELSVILTAINSPHRGFISGIRKKDPVISAGEIELSARLIGVFDDLWPPDQGYLKSLRVPERYMEPKRLLLAKVEEVKAEASRSVDLAA